MPYFFEGREVTEELAYAIVREFCENCVDDDGNPFDFDYEIHIIDNGGCSESGVEWNRDAPEHYAEWADSPLKILFDAIVREDFALIQECMRNPDITLFTWSVVRNKVSKVQSINGAELAGNIVVLTDGMDDMMHIDTSSNLVVYDNDYDSQVQWTACGDMVAHEFIRREVAKGVHTSDVLSSDSTPKGVE